MLVNIFVFNSIWLVRVVMFFLFFLVEAGPGPVLCPLIIIILIS